MESKTFRVEGTFGGQPVAVKVDPPQSNWVDPFLPALPGVVVALVGIWLSHGLTARRDRRKEIIEICERVKDLTEEAAEAGTEAWMAPPGEDRDAKVIATKRKLQALGIAATNLRRRSRSGWVRHVHSAFGNVATSVDVRHRVATFRGIVTDDPFEVRDRPANPEMADQIIDDANGLMSEVDHQFARLYSQ